MAQVQKVSWRTVGYAALGAAAIVAGTVGIVRSDGVRPASLKSNASTRWLVDQINHRLVLADGLTGRVLARIKTESESSAQIAAQGAGGAFLTSPADGTVRTISTAKFALGAVQRVGPLGDDVDFDAVQVGVGVNGLTIINTLTDEANLVSADESPRPISVPRSDEAYVARDGSMWLFAATQATHVAVDGTRHSFDVRGNRSATATVGTHAVYLDRPAGVVHWLDGGDVPVGSIPNVADAILQVQRGDEAPCVWLAANENVACIGKTGIDKRVVVPGLAINPTDRLAVAGSVAVIIRSGTNQVDRIDLDTQRFITGGDPDPAEGHQLNVYSINKMVWIDDVDGTVAWAVHSLGYERIDKADEEALLLNAQGQVEQEGAGEGGESPSGGGVPGDSNPADQLDDNDQEDKPVAVDDSVTARAGNTVIVPVTANDYDPDGQAIALLSVDDGQQPGHGAVDVLDGTSVSYVPEVGYSGADSFEYEIVDEMGNTDTGKVTVELFPPDSPNRPPITQDDHVKTRIGHAVTIDVLSNDIDPERDLLTIFTFAQTDEGTISETTGPTGLPALKYTPPAGGVGPYTFSYQAADTQGGVSDDTEVTVEVLDADAPNLEPVARPDAIRLRVGSKGDVNVLANDSDPDGDDLTIAVKEEAPGVTAEVVGQQLRITMHASAADSSVVRYDLTDGEHHVPGRVLVLRIDDDTPNRPPVANPDRERVLIGKSVKVNVLANDIDPENDPVSLLTVDDPPGGVGIAEVEGDFVRFTPNLPDIDESTPVTFNYRIGDGHGNTAIGHVTVDVLAEPLPRNPVAVNDFAETDAREPITIDVLHNDSDPNGGKPNLIGTPVCINGGSAVSTPEEKVTFTPPTDEIDGGEYRCEYRVRGSQGEAAAWIIVTVRPLILGNHPPQAVQSELSQTIQIGTSFAFNANTVASDPDGDPLQFDSVGSPTFGSTNFAGPTTTFTYFASATPASDIPLLVNLSVQISDGQGGILTTQISIRLVDNTPKPPNVPPATRQIDRLGEVDALTTVPVVGDLSLMSANQGLTLSLVTAKAEVAAQADVVPNTSDGTVAITPRVSGQVRISYTVRSDDGETAGGFIVLTVSDKQVQNDPPVAVDDDLTVPSGGSGSVDLFANDDGISDPGDQPFATVLLPPPASFGSVSVDNGTLTLIANPNFSGGFFRASYSLNDGSGQSDTAFINLQIDLCTDSPPSAQAASAFTPYMTPININLNNLVTSGNIVVSSISGAGLTGPTGTYTPPAGKNDSEVVTFDVVNACNQVAHGSLTIDVNRAPTALPTSINVSAGAVQTLLPSTIADDDEPLTVTALQGPAWVTVAPDGSSITIAPPPEAAGSFPVTATVSDPGLLSTTAVVTVTVNNTAPTANNDAYFIEDSLFQFDPTLNDTDPELGPLAVQTVSVVDGPGMVQNIVGNTVIVNVGHGKSEFSYTIHDAGGLTATATITIISNHNPIAPNVSDSTNQPSIAINFGPTDPDSQDQGRLDIECSAPDGWSVIILTNPDPGPPPVPDRVSLYITIPADAGPSTPIQCEVTDPFGGKAFGTVTVNVTT